MPRRCIIYAQSQHGVNKRLLKVLTIWVNRTLACIPPMPCKDKYRAGNTHRFVAETPVQHKNQQHNESRVQFNTESTSVLFLQQEDRSFEQKGVIY
jgi:hypothetical protein